VNRIDQSAASRFLPTERASQHDRFAGHDFGNCVADLLTVGVHQPGHHLFIRAQVRCRDIPIRANHIDDLHGIPTSQPLQFGPRQHGRIDPDATFRSAERQLHQRAFPGHPHGECGDFAQIDILVIADATFRRTHGQHMLHAVSDHRFYVLVVVAAEGQCDHHRSLWI